MLDEWCNRLTVLGVGFTRGDPAAAAQQKQQQLPVLPGRASSSSRSSSSGQHLSVLLQHPSATTFHEVEVNVQACCEEDNQLQLDLTLPSDDVWKNQPHQFPASSERLWHGPIPGEPGSCWHRGQLGGLVWTSSSSSSAAGMLGAACNSSSAVPRLLPAVFYNNRDVCAAAHQVCSVAPEALADICR